MYKRLDRFKRYFSSEAKKNVAMKSEKSIKGQLPSAPVKSGAMNARELSI